MEEADVAELTAESAASSAAEPRASFWADAVPTKTSASEAPTTDAIVGKRLIEFGFMGLLRPVGLRGKKPPNRAGFAILNASKYATSALPHRA